MSIIYIYHDIIGTDYNTTHVQLEHAHVLPATIVYSYSNTVIILAIMFGLGGVISNPSLASRSPGIGAPALTNSSAFMSKKNIVPRSSKYEELLPGKCEPGIFTRKRGMLCCSTFVKHLIAPFCSTS